MESNAPTLEPLLFWPFRGTAAGLADMRQGRNRCLWNDHLGAAWGTNFGNEEAFLTFAAQLEFILEFNSYIFEGVNNPAVNQLKRSLGNRSFAYLPDFWTNRLDPTVPVAEHFYDILREKPTLPVEFAIEKEAVDLTFSGKDSRNRLLFLGGFLAHLETWQEQVMMQQQRFPFVFEWPGRLQEIVKTFKSQTRN